MNLILFTAEDFYGTGERVRLHGRRLRHVQEIHRASVGDSLRVGLLGGKIGTGVVTRLDREALEMEVALKDGPPSPSPATLVLALPRPKVVKRTLLAAASLGVKKIYLIHAWRVEKSYWKSPRLEEEKIREALVLGLEQARDTLLPEVVLRPLFKPFVEDELPEIVSDTLPLVAHVGEEEPCPRQVQGPVTLAVGPEGGFIPYEIEKLKECGFRAVSLGERPLRVETAVPVFLARLF